MNIFVLNIQSLNSNDTHHLEGYRMSKFCHSCGTQIAHENVKFCPECGATLIQKVSVEKNEVIAQVQTNSKIENEDDDTVIEENQGLSYNELGKKLEAFTAEILIAEGWSVRSNVRDNLESGARAEFDVIASKTRNGRLLTRIVECKNYSSAVGRDKIDVFSKKIESYPVIKNPSKLFVAINFSSDARKQADYENVTLWDGNDLREKIFSIKIGRYQGQIKEMTFKNALPLLIDYTSIIKLDLENSDKVSVNSAKLVWRPFYKIVYSLFVSKTDPKGHAHKVKDSGECIVDAQDGMVLNLPVPKENVSIFGLPDIKFKDSEEDLFVTELKSVPEQNYHLQLSPDYQVIKLEPKITKHFARESALNSIIYKNTETFKYEVNSRKRSDSVFDLPDTREFTIVPKKSDISIKETLLVFVPKWDIEFVSGDQIYRRETIGHKGTVISDSIKYCPKHKIIGNIITLKKNTIAVCEVDGKALCKDHVFKCPICNKWFCEEHSVECAICGTHYCPEHIGKCADCGSPLCDACTKVCPICGETHCKKHWVKCEKCGTEVCSSCITSKSGMIFKKFTCKKCSP